VGETLIDSRCPLCGWLGETDETLCPRCGHGLVTYEVVLEDDS
jgi:uncharacterized Zn finger protein (UPF0148 family)